MITWTYDPEDTKEFTPIRKVIFELDNEVIWRDLVNPFNSFLSAIGYIPLEFNTFVKAIDEE